MKRHRKRQFNHALKELEQGLKARDKGKYLLSKCSVILYVYSWLKSRVYFDKYKHSYFFQIYKSKCLLFAKHRCKTVGTKRQTLSESQTLMFFHKNI